MHIHVHVHCVLLYIFNLQLHVHVHVFHKEQAGEASKLVFTLAGIVVLLWHDFPEFGDLFLAHCYHTCPVLVPLYFRKNKGMSEIEFKKYEEYQHVL